MRVRRATTLPIGFANCVGLASHWAFPGIPCHRPAAVRMEVQRAGAGPSGGQDTDARGGGGVAVGRVAGWAPWAVGRVACGVKQHFPQSIRKGDRLEY